MQREIDSDIASVTDSGKGNSEQGDRTLNSKGMHIRYIINDLRII